MQPPSPFRPAGPRTGGGPPPLLLRRRRRRPRQSRASSQPPWRRGPGQGAPWRGSTSSRSIRKRPGPRRGLERGGAPSGPAAGAGGRGAPPAAAAAAGTRTATGTACPAPPAARSRGGGSRSSSLGSSDTSPATGERGTRRMPWKRRMTRTKRKTKKRRRKTKKRRTTTTTTKRSTLPPSIRPSCPPRPRSCITWGASRGPSSPGTSRTPSSAPSRSAWRRRSSCWSTGGRSGDSAAWQAWPTAGGRGRRAEEEAAGGRPTPWTTARTRPGWSSPSPRGTGCLTCPSSSPPASPGAGSLPRRTRPRTRTALTPMAAPMAAPTAAERCAGLRRRSPPRRPPGSRRSWRRPRPFPRSGPRRQSASPSGGTPSGGGGSAKPSRCGGTGASTADVPCGRAGTPP